jgi:predicted metal-dependent phosphoesterase TrpH
VIDLHVHTNKSDGEFSPKETICIAKENDIDIISITDHDTCKGVTEALDQGEKLGIKVIPGIEITAFENEEIHILGYGVDYKSHLLDEYEIELEDCLRNEKEVIFNTFEKFGFKVSEEEIEKYSKGASVAPGHFVNWLIEKGYETNKKQAFIKYFVKGELKNRKADRMSIKQAIEFIKELNGLPVFAHPCRTSYNKEELEEKIKELKNTGLRGIETMYSMATDEQISFYNELAKRYDLLITIGSDYHGPDVKDYIEMGTGEENNLVKYQGNSNFNQLILAQFENMC